MDGYHTLRCLQKYMDFTVSGLISKLSLTKNQTKKDTLKLENMISDNIRPKIK